jgi:hypothetical protein
MKTLVSTLTLAAAVAFTGYAFAQDVTSAATKEDCEKAGGAWNVEGNKCAEESAKMGKESGTQEGAQLGAAPDQDTQKIDQPARTESDR